MSWHYLQHVDFFSQRLHFLFMILLDSLQVSLLLVDVLHQLPPGVHLELLHLGLQPLDLLNLLRLLPGGHGGGDRVGEGGVGPVLGHLGRGLASDVDRVQLEVGQREQRGHHLGLAEAGGLHEDGPAVVPGPVHLAQRRQVHHLLQLLLAAAGPATGVPSNLAAMY